MKYQRGLCLLTAALLWWAGGPWSTASSGMAAAETTVEIAGVKTAVDETMAAVLDAGANEPSAGSGAGSATGVAADQNVQGAEAAASAQPVATAKPTTTTAKAAITADPPATPQPTAAEAATTEAATAAHPTKTAETAAIPQPTATTPQPTAAAPTAAPSTAPMPPEIQAALEKQLVSIFDFYNTMGGCVAVLQNGQVTYTYSYGTRTNGGEPVTPDSLFQVGSISKLVGNIGLMQLLEAQNIPLDTDIGSLLGFPVRHPDYPDLPITLRQVMTHTAALADSSAYDAGLDGNGISLQQMFSGQWAEASFLPGVKPGSKSVYSNLGGGLIGVLIEQLSGQTLDDYMTENVFAPLGITATYQPGRLAEGAPLCDLYLMPQRRLSKSLREETSFYTQPDPARHYYLTAGKLVISAPDLAKLLIALCDGGVYEDVRLLSGVTVREMRTLQNDRWSVGCESGRGLFMNIYTDLQVEGRTLYGHGGKAHGMLCAAYFDPSDRTGVVMLTNGCRNKPSRMGVGLLGRRILSAVYVEWLDKCHVEADAFSVE